MLDKRLGHNYFKFYVENIQFPAAIVCYIRDESGVGPFHPPHLLFSRPQSHTLRHHRDSKDLNTSTEHVIFCVEGTAVTLSASLHATTTF